MPAAAVVVAAAFVVVVVIVAVVLFIFSAARCGELRAVPAGACGAAPVSYTHLTLPTIYSV